MGQLATKQEKVRQVTNLLANLKPSIVRALPRHMDPDRVLRIALTSIKKNPKLLECTADSLCACLLTCSQRGLAPDSSSQHAHLIPFKDRKSNITVCTLIFGYSGLMDLALRHPNVRSFHVPQVVYENDHAEFEYGLEPKLVHKPPSGPDRGKPVAYYAVAKLENGDTPFVWLWYDDAVRVRDAIPHWQTGAWKDHFDAMALKTAVRRLCKWLPSSADLQDALAADGQVLNMDDVDPASMIDVPAVSAPSRPESLEDLTPDAPTTEPPPKKRGRPAAKPKSGPDPEPLLGEQAPDGNDDKPELWHLAIGKLWVKIPLGHRGAALLNVGVAIYPDIAKISDTATLRAIHEAFVGEVSAEPAK